MGRLDREQEISFFSAEKADIARAQFSLQLTAKVLSGLLGNPVVEYTSCYLISHRVDCL